MRDVIKPELAFFALYYERRFNEFVKEFVDERRMCSLNTLKKYLKELEVEGLLQKTSSGVYIVSNKNKDEIEEMKFKRETEKGFDESWESLREYLKNKDLGELKIRFTYVG